MVFGILMTGFVFVTGVSLLGWLAGHAIDAVRYGRTTGMEATVKTK